LGRDVRDPVILRSTVVLTALIVVARLITELIGWLKPGKDLTEVRIRIRSWLVIMLAIEAFLYGGKATTIFFSASISFFGLREYLSRVPTRTVDRRVLFWVFLAIPLQFSLIYYGWMLAFLCFVPIYGISVLTFRLLLTGEPKGFVMALATFQLGLISTVYSVGHLAYLAVLPQPGGFVVSAGAVLFLIVTTELNDVFQFITGKTFGKHKIMPRISPNKTVEGFVGGVVLTTALSAFVAPLLTPLTLWQGVAAGVCLAVFGFLGDVLMSAIKRDLGIKDFSQIIPGHGGVLDRIDSLIISAPIFFHLMRLSLPKGAP
jgi:phosphatidate cytidylyltransferase